MRAPYISMSESSELPMLIAEDLMWGAQPDLKQTLNITNKTESNTENIDSQQPQKPTAMESSLASLLCSQLLHQQQQQQQQQINQTEQQTILNQQPDVKIKILDHGSNNITIISPNALMSQSQETRKGS